MERKNQTGTEFLIISGVVLFFFTMFFVAIQVNTAERNKEKEELIVKNLALSIQDEINLASEASEGYRRNFFVPEKISGRDYTIEIIEGSIYIKTDLVALSLNLANVTGQIQKGSNLIKKEDGVVKLNS
jgi:hypothetical protein